MTIEDTMQLILGEEKQRLIFFSDLIYDADEAFLSCDVDKLSNKEIIDACLKLKEVEEIFMKHQYKDNLSNFPSEENSQLETILDLFSYQFKQKMKPNSIKLRTDFSETLYQKTLSKLLELLQEEKNSLEEPDVWEEIEDNNSPIVIVSNNYEANIFKHDGDEIITFTERKGDKNV